MLSASLRRKKMADSKSYISFNPILIGFVAGFLATLTFHQGTLWVLWRMGIAAFPPYAMAGVPPFGIPAVLSTAFWGGLWGILFAVIHHRFPRTGYWVAAFLFGAVLPSLVAFFIVAPLKGRPVAGGWQATVMLKGFLINGMWGLGTGAFIKLLGSRFRIRQADECPPGAICGH
jgi:hypothetical protein